MDRLSQPDTVSIRSLTDSDDIEILTALLHRAYARLAVLGFNYTAVDQTSDVTRSRLEDGKCFVAEMNGRIVGTILFYPAGTYGGCPWYDKPGIAKVAQFAVEPTLQGYQIGARLLKRAEEEAIASGADEIALDTAEGADHLVTWYKRCGYRLIEHIQWQGKVYRSVILSKKLGNGT